jgi:hypothetical protein
VPAVRAWYAATPADAPTIGGLVFLSVASLAAGMTVSAVRWASVDTWHARRGLPAPDLDFARLPGRVDEFRLLIEIHYRHYQFYANMLVAVAAAYAGYRASAWCAAPGPADLAFVVLEPVFYFASRDTLRKYYARSARLLSPPQTPP